MAQKQCSKCKEFKDLKEFSKDSSTKDGLKCGCRPCRGKESKEWQRNNPGKTSTASAKWYTNNPDGAKNRTLKLKYGITIETFNELLKSQDNLCAICKKPETATDKRLGGIRTLAVDHCHKTGKVRGLLCTCCNGALGFIKEDMMCALSLVKYIENNQEK